MHSRKNKFKNKLRFQKKFHKKFPKKNSKKNSKRDKFPPIAMYTDLLYYWESMQNHWNQVELPYKVFQYE
jgi:Zn-finger domain-containing protein